ncbi:MAG: RluA family pseudouridine synthase [Deltaproteobacteria bacterium]|nr:RluA family pseudouridine synthase [Deltaproteobacteria bacterium]
MRLVDHAKDFLVVVPVREVGALIAQGALSIDGRRGAIADPVPAGSVVTVDAAAIASCVVPPEARPLVVRYEDDDLLVCDKPAGMHVHPLGEHRTGTLLNALLWHCGARPDQPWGRWRPRPLHRLDRAASGLIAFGKCAAVHDDVRRQLAEHAIERRYLAVVHGRVAAATGTIASPLGRDPTCDYRRAVVPEDQGGQRAVTHFTRVEQGDDRTLLELELDTGRTHQIRAHLASIGHPIVGDVLYADGGARRDAAPAIALHACELRLRHPRHGTPIVCSSPMQ